MALLIPEIDLGASASGGFLLFHCCVSSIENSIWISKYVTNAVIRSAIYLEVNQSPQMQYGDHRSDVSFSQV